MKKDQGKREEKARERHSKKTWERPRMRSGKLFEANTVSCAQQSGNVACIPQVT